MAAPAARERDAAIRARRQKRLRDNDSGAAASAQAENTSGHAASRLRLQADSPEGAAIARVHDSAARAELRSRVVIDAVWSEREGSENDEETSGMEGTARPQGLCAAKIFSVVEGYDAEPSNFGDIGVVFQKCKAYDWMDERLKSSSNRRPLFLISCGNGAVDIPAFPGAPEPLRAWALGETARDRTMENNLRLLNNALALTSSQGRSPPPVPGGSAWEAAFRPHGQLSHYAVPLLAAEGREASFLQAYIVDSEENGERPAAVGRAVAHGRGGEVVFGRISMSELDSTSRGLFDAVQTFYDMLLSENNLVKNFLTARGRLQQIEAITGRPVRSLRVVVHERLLLQRAVTSGCATMRQEPTVRWLPFFLRVVQLCRRLRKVQAIAGRAQAGCCPHDSRAT